MGAQQGEESASARIVKLTLLMIVLALGIYLAANVVRERWVLAGLGLSGALFCTALYVLVAQMPGLGRTVGLVIAALMIGVPPGFYVFDPASHAAAMPLMAVAAVGVLSMLSPVTGLVAIGVEALALVMFAITSEAMTLQTVVSFAVVAAPVHVLSRWLSEALRRADALRGVARERGADLGRALRHIGRGDGQPSREQEGTPAESAPLLEVMPGTGLLVVAGRCGAQRVAAIEGALLDALRDRKLGRIVIDVSTAELEQEGVEALIRMLRALSVMVSDVVLCGVSPGAARGIAGNQEQVRDLRGAARFVHSLREALADRGRRAAG
ncbi:MAG: hypothetical protein JXA09_00855 [Anaerolineae bacterium]|nr:hypothetical protein [Anaerolineae bacterium]